MTKTKTKADYKKGPAKSSGWVPPDNESSTIKFLKWDEGNKLTIHFHNGNRKYEYQNVTREVFTDLRTAKSAGTYHNQHIKAWPETYPFKEVT